MEETKPTARNNKENDDDIDFTQKDPDAEDFSAIDEALSTDSDDSSSSESEAEGSCSSGNIKQEPGSPLTRSTDLTNGDSATSVVTTEEEAAKKEDYEKVQS